MEFFFHVINTICIFIVLGVSLNLIMGYAGLVSMAHAGFFGIGAYAAAIVARDLGWNYPATMLVGVVLTVVIAGLSALPALRVRGEYLILMTIALQLVIYNLSLSWVELTNGRTGISGVSRPVLMGNTLTSPTEWFPLLAVLTLVTFFIAYRVGQSPLGRVLKAIREDERATLSIGKNVVGYKVLVFMVAGGLAAVAGSTFVHYQSFINPFSITLHASIFIVALVVLGGTANLYGTVVGAFLLVGLPEVLRFLQADQEIVDALRNLIYGVLLVLFMRFRPEGFIPEYFRVARARGGGPEGVGRPQATADRGTDPSRAELKGPDAAPGRVEPDPSVAADATGTGQLEPETAPEVVLSARGLDKSFGGIRATAGLDLDLPRGKITALVGPNGAGKTTVFNLLTGFLVPDAGRIELRGRDIGKTPPWRRTRLGLARSFQDVRLFERMTVLDNVLVAIPNQPGENLFQLFFAPRLVARAEQENRQKAMRYLEFVGLADKADHLVSELSYGEQKLLALARLMATEAEVLLLDEPAAGVDLYWVDRILKLLRQLAAEGKTIFLVEHNLEVVTAVADRAYFLDVGRIIAEGTPRQLMADRHLTQIYFGVAGATAQ